MERKPKYKEVVDWVKGRLEKKELSPGDKLNSENELSELFGLSRQTVRHAIGVLEEEGIVARRQGSGTYISDNRMANLENKTRVAVVTTYVDSYIFPRTIQGIENTLFERGYSVQIAFTNNQLERERTILEDITARDDVVGIIMEATKSGLPNPNLPLLQKLMERKIPILFINSFYPGLPLPHVTLSDRLAAEMAVEYLIHAGHRKVGALLKFDDGQGHLRYAGYLDTCRKAGIPAGDSGIVWLDTEGEQHLHDYRERILRNFKECTAVFCYNDKIAFQLEVLLKEEGIRVPEDISLISIDDSELAELAETRLTSVHHPTDKLGARAAENLLAIMKNRNFDGNYEFVTEIVERDSVRSLNRV